MSYAIRVKHAAISLRKKGSSIKEIASQLGISVATSSLWCSSIPLSQKALEIIETKKGNALMLANKALHIIRQKHRNAMAIQLRKEAESIQYTRALCRLLCALFIWTEGGKSEKYRVSFTNSDPKMIRTFVALFRRGFRVDETKFRGLLHIHEYHNEADMLQFWSSMTNIPAHQFTKSYRKPHTGKRIREGYKGSVHITYYDSNVAHTLAALYNIFAETIGAW